GVLECASRRGYREVDVFGIPGRNVVDHLAERGVIDLERTAVARIHPLTVDQHPLGLLQETCGVRCRLDGGDHDVSPMLEDSLADAHQALMEGRVSRVKHRMPATGAGIVSAEGAAGLAGARRAVRLLCAGARVGYRLRKTGFRRESPAV